MSDVPEQELPGARRAQPEPVHAATTGERVRSLPARREALAATYRRRRTLVLGAAGLAIAVLLTMFLFRPRTHAASIESVGYPSYTPQKTSLQPPTNRPARTATPAGPGTFPQSGQRLGDWFVSTYTTPSPAKFRVAVLIEPGLEVDANGAGKLVDSVLNDARGWYSMGYSFQLVSDPEAADIRIHVATPATTDHYCYPQDTGGYVSCTWASGDIYLNSDRWRTGVPHFKSLDTYREYLISHETGHALGYGHVPCGGPGKPAPVMMQQTYGLDGCTENGWVSVTGG